MSNFKRVDELGYVNLDLVAKITSPSLLTDDTWTFSIIYVGGDYNIVRHSTKDECESVIRRLLEK